MEKKKSDFKVLLMRLVFMVIGVGMGLLAGMGLGKFLKAIKESSGKGPALAGLIAALLWFAAALILSTVLHEAGHLVMGRATGYEFIS